MKWIVPPVTVQKLLKARLDLPNEEWAKLMIESLSEAEMMELITYAARLSVVDLTLGFQSAEYPVPMSYKLAGERAGLQ